jgi:SAM-dependent methyltransferase
MQPCLAYISKGFSKAIDTYNYHATFQYDMALKIANKIHTPPKHILEIGCGTGILTKILHQKFPDSFFTLIDISKPMLCSLEKILGNNKMTYIHCSGSDIGNIFKIIQHHNIDLIVSNLCFQWFDRPLEIYNLYQHYANICISTLTDNSFYQWYDSIQSVIPCYKPPITTISANDFCNHHGYHIRYQSGFNFLRSQQKLGTLNHQYFHLTPQKIKQACIIFQEKHHNIISYFPSILSNFS